MSVLQILSVLVKFGYYDDSSDVSDLLPSIHKLLNGSKDFPRKISMKAERSISFLRTNLQDREFNCCVISHNKNAYFGSSFD